MEFPLDALFAETIVIAVLGLGLGVEVFADMHF